MSKENEKDQLDEDALAALVKPSMPPVAPEAESSSSDDDGVLDLRALASSMAPAAPEPEPAKPEAVEAKKDEPAPAKTADEPAEKAESKKKDAASPKKAAEREPEKKKAATPVATPVAEAAPAAKGSNMWIGVVIGAAAAAGIVWFMGRGGDAPEGTEVASGPPSVVHTTEEEQPAPSTTTALEAPALEPEGEVAPVGETAPAEMGEATAEAAVEAAAEVAPAGVATARAGRARTARGNPASTAAATTTASAAETPAAASTTTAAASTMTSSMQAASAGGTTTAPAPGGLDSVLDQALGGRPAAGGTRTVATAAQTQAAAPAAPSGNLPDSPSRADVARALGRLLPQIRQCAGEQVGLANATILVRNDGSVASVSIGGNPFGGTPQGACMEGIIRGAQFSPFRQSTFRITYPFALRAAQ